MSETMPTGSSHTAWSGQPKGLKNDKTDLQEGITVIQPNTFGFVFTSRQYKESRDDGTQSNAFLTWVTRPVWPSGTRLTLDIIEPRWETACSVIQDVGNSWKETHKGCDATLYQTLSIPWTENFFQRELEESFERLELTDNPAFTIVDEETYDQVFPPKNSQTGEYQDLHYKYTDQLNMKRMSEYPKRKQLTSGTATRP